MDGFFNVLSMIMNFCWDILAFKIELDGISVSLLGILIIGSILLIAAWFFSNLKK